MSARRWIHPLAAAALALFALPCLGAGESATIGASLTCTPNAGTPARPTDCPYLSELLKGDKAFRTEYQRALRSGKVPALAGPEGPVVPVDIGGEKYMAGNRCEAHNCSDHRIDFLYAVRTRSISGIYLSRDGKRRWFGNPGAIEKEKLTQLSRGQ